MQHCHHSLCEMVFRICFWSDLSQPWGFLMLQNNEHGWVYHILPLQSCEIVLYLSYAPTRGSPWENWCCMTYSSLCASTTSMRGQGIMKAITVNTYLVQRRPLADPAAEILPLQCVLERYGITMLIRLKHIEILWTLYSFLVKVFEATDEKLRRDAS